MKAVWRYLTPVSLLILCASLASAQMAADVNLGFGSAHAKANSSGIDSVDFTSCTPGATVTCDKLPSLSGLFMGFGGGVLLTKRYGIGAEVSFQPTRTDYGPLQSRELFYDFDGWYQALNEKRFGLRFRGGIGGARTSFIFPSSSCVGNICQNQNIPLANESHFQVHAGVGVSLYVTEHVFVRPEFTIRYVPGLDNVFGSNVVPQGMIWLGYTLGDRQ